MSTKIVKTPIELSWAQKYQMAREIIIRSKPKLVQNEINKDPKSRFNDQIWREIIAFAENPKNLSILEDCFETKRPPQLEVEK